MKVLWLATNNLHKQDDMSQLLGSEYQIKTLCDLSEQQITDIEEVGTSFEENALIKAQVLSSLIQGPAVGDDSGLEIVALNNFPGIYSARWINTGNGYQLAMQTILEKMQDVANRDAQYICVLAYVDVTKGIKKVFRGILKGTIAFSARGINGFGYDPIFYLPLYDKTCAEITRAMKNKISHRYQALQKLLTWIESESKNESKEN